MEHVIKMGKIFICKESSPIRISWNTPEKVEKWLSTDVHTFVDVGADNAASHWFKSFSEV